MKIHEVLEMKSKDWLHLGGKLATAIVKDADKGISQDGKGEKFPKYKKSYSDLKKAGKASPTGISDDRQVNPPNLRLTGTMLDSIKARNATKESVEILFADGLKVEGNARPPARLKKPRRNIYGLNEKNEKKIQEFIESKYDTKIKRFIAEIIEFDINV
mgnify:CR=1 FL=1